ncbi:hypothetical protein Bca101_075249 [Brassica carinata]
MSIRDDDPIGLPDNPCFSVFGENATSLLGRLLNPSCQPMDEMIETMPRVWRVYNRVRVPPKDFLTTVDVWVRISRIPMNHYRLETMDFLASKVGKVLEIAYDPKCSQKEAFIRAQVRLDITRPALEKKVLNLPSGGQAVIEFEYEKLRKPCFHCLWLTHERPDCPYIREKVRPVFKEVVVSSNGGASNLKDPVGTAPPQGPAVPPGFSPMFPQLAEEERNAALQYVSNSDPTEHQARIMRVHQSITDKGAIGARQMPVISHNLEKGKCHVFGYEGQRKIGGDEFCSSKSMPFKLSTGLIVSCGADDLEVSSSSSPVGPTVFRIGSSTINHPAGTKSDGKTSRRRPQRWKRLSQTKACVDGDGDGLAGTDDALKKSALAIHGEDTVASAGFSKRKAVSWRLLDYYSTVSVYGFRCSKVVPVLDLVGQ